MSRQVIPGKFYWMPNAVADYWSDFRYPVMKKIPTGEMGINRRPAYRYESTVAARASRPSLLT